MARLFWTYQIFDLDFIFKVTTARSFIFYRCLKATVTLFEYTRGPNGSHWTYIRFNKKTYRTGLQAVTDINFLKDRPSQPMP